MQWSVIVLRCRPKADASSSTDTCSYACSTPYATKRSASRPSRGRSASITSSATVACMLREITAPSVSRVSVTWRKAMPLICARAKARISCSSE